MLCNDVRAALRKVCESICQQRNGSIQVADCLTASFIDLREAEVALAQAEFGFIKGLFTLFKIPEFKLEVGVLFLCLVFCLFFCFSSAFFKQLM